MKKSSLLVLVLFLWAVQPLAKADEPRIDGQRIIFDGGAVMQYSTKTLLYSDPEHARQKRQPIWIAEKPVLIREWRRLILQTTNHYAEGETKTIALYDYSGNLVFPKITFVGELFLLTVTERIFLIQKSPHSQLRRSFVLDKDGALIRVLHHGELRSAGHSDDGKVVWLLAASGMGGKPCTDVVVVDFNGVELKTERKCSAGKTRFVYRDKTYEVDVLAPELP